MSQWTCFRLTYRALAPINIGYRPVGIIQRTRYYLPARVLHGAITAGLARCLYANPAGVDYDTVGEVVKKWLRPSYFYPHVEDEPLLAPRYTNEGLLYGKRNAADFQARHIASAGQTAIAPANWVAEEGSLHETEFLVSRVAQSTDSGARPIDVHFVGHLFAPSGPVSDSGIEIAPDEEGSHDIIVKRSNRWIRLFTDVMQELSVGGERRYGFGRIRLNNRCKLTSGMVIWDGFNVDMDNLGVGLADSVAVAYLPTHAQHNVAGVLNGELEPVVGREWENKTNPEGRQGPGQRVVHLGVCWVPGTRIEASNDEIFSARVGDFGIWEPSENSIGDVQ